MRRRPVVSRRTVKRAIIVTAAHRIGKRAGKHVEKAVENHLEKAVENRLGKR
jgi:hypothetical protein